MSENQAGAVQEEAPFEITESQHAWATSNGRFWQPTPTANRLPAGVYKVGMSQRLGPYLDLVQVVKDELLLLPGMGADVILHEIKQFWARRDRYKQRGVVHKRGILMEGPPGSGKTSNAELVVELFMKQLDGIALITGNPAEMAIGIELIRRREPLRPILVLLEDIDALCRGSSEEPLLQLLDGREQNDGVVVVATTNYLDKLPDRIANRPSRFDMVVKIGLPSDAARRVYLTIKAPELSKDKIEKMVGLTDKFSIAHLKELLILTQVYEMGLDEAVIRIKAIVDRKLLPEQASIKLGARPAMNIHEVKTDADAA